MVIGSHPHVVQDVAVYKGTPIIYSLGNFVFDQHFSDEVSRGLLAGIFSTLASVTISIVPISHSSGIGETYIPKRVGSGAKDVFGDRMSAWDDYLDTKTGLYHFPRTQ
jgi:poly-gamma-glutamate synthesis protein (capsule biosynthesis protein)